MTSRGTSKPWAPGMRWHRWEIVFYVVVTAVETTYVFLRASALSIENTSYIYGLSRSPWGSGMYFDNYDVQWRTIRSNLPLLFLLAIFHRLVSTAVKYYTYTNRRATYFNVSVLPDHEPQIDQMPVKDDVTTPTTPIASVLSPHVLISISTAATSLPTSPQILPSTSSSASSSSQSSSHSSVNLSTDLQSYNAKDSQRFPFDAACPAVSPSYGCFENQEQFLQNEVIPHRKCLIHILVGTAFIFVLHQSGALYYFFFICCNFLIVKVLTYSPSLFSKSHCWRRDICLPIYTWAFCTTILFANDYWNGYQFSWISAKLSFLDNYQGVYRWTNPFNFAILRMISFNFDYLWALQGKRFQRELNTQREVSKHTTDDCEKSPVKHSKTNIENLTDNTLRRNKNGSPTVVTSSLGCNVEEQITYKSRNQNNKDFNQSGKCYMLNQGLHSMYKCIKKGLGQHTMNNSIEKGIDSHIHQDLNHYLDRQECHQPLSDYNTIRYLAYMVYPPLYLAGPICSFNAWSSQITTPQYQYNSYELLRYGLQWIASFVMMEIFIHRIYVTAILTNPANRSLWKESFSITAIAMMALLSFFHIWMKLLLTWRFFRLWSLVDGIDVPENMTRCVFNNYSMEVFWKCWHRSFNQWLLRYLYFPLGGSRVSIARRVFNVALVFTYVALWHDINLKLLSWSWLILLVFTPELVIRSIFSQRRFSKFRSSLKYRYGCVCVTTLNALAMAVANLVGFTFGVEGLRDLWLVTSLPQLITLIVLSFLYLYMYQNVTLWIETRRDGVLSTEALEDVIDMQQQQVTSTQMRMFTG